jgi:hypothetical protein
MGSLLIFLLPALISIPVGIVTNLLTPKLQLFAGKFSSRARERNQRRKKSEEVLVRWLAANPSVFFHYMQHEGIKVLFGQGVVLFGALTFVILAFSLGLTSGSSNAPIDSMSGLLMIAVSIGMAISMAGVGVIDRRRNRRQLNVAKLNGWYTWHGKVWGKEAGKFVNILDEMDGKSLSP